MGIEFLKYEIRKFSIEFSKLQAENTKKEKTFLENKLKKLENNTNYIENLEYIDCRNKLDKIYEQKINGIRVNATGTNTVKSLQNFFLILRKLDLHKAQFEILQKIKKTLHIIQELIKNFLTFIKAYFRKLLTCPRIKLCNF